MRLIEFAIFQFLVVQNIYICVQFMLMLLMDSDCVCYGCYCSSAPIVPFLLNRQSSGGRQQTNCRKQYSNDQNRRNQNPEPTTTWILQALKNNKNIFIIINIYYKYIFIPHSYYIWMCVYDLINMYIKYTKIYNIKSI